jgi:hypothetical protein
MSGDDTAAETCGVPAYRYPRPPWSRAIVASSKPRPVRSGHHFVYGVLSDVAGLAAGHYVPRSRGIVSCLAQRARDGRATFSGLGVSLDPKSSTPVASRVFTFAVPLSGAAPDTEIPFFVQGTAFSEKAGNGHLVFSVNEQTMVADFPGKSEQEFLQEFKFKVGSASEIRVTVFLLADHDSKSDAQVSLNVTTIDTDVAKHKR